MRRKDPNNFFTAPASNHCEVFLQYPHTEALFIHIPKNAGSTIRHNILRKSPHEWFNDKYTSHYTVNDVIIKYGYQRYRNAYSFAFLRDPFDRFMSWVRYVKRHDTHRIFGKTNKVLLEYALDKTPVELFQKLFRDTYDFNGVQPRLSDNVHLWPQRNFIEDSWGEISLNFLGTTENFTKDIAEVARYLKLNLPKNIGLVNSSNHNDHLQKYEQDQGFRRAVEEYYALDKKLYDEISLNNSTKDNIDLLR